MTRRHVIVGAGPAGLTVAWELSRLGEQCLVLEADPKYVGGLARTVEYKGHHFDMGGHRFYSKSDEINRVWSEMLTEDWVEVGRMSRIFYGGKFYPYPLSATTTLKNLGLWKATLMMSSYLKAQVFPVKNEESFEDWMVNRFGQRLYRTFFKTYTEKVWGIPCSTMNKDWAAQRIQGLSLYKAVRDSLFPPRGDSKIKTLIRKFRYPRLGPGQLWEAVVKTITKAGSRVELGKEVTKIRHEEGKVLGVETADGGYHVGDSFYTTLPLSDLILSLSPAAPDNVVRAAKALKHRDFLTVALVVNQPDLFPDNWIYIHDPGVSVGRIQNYKNWSPAMVAEPGLSCLGMEYFCNRGDSLWSMSNADLIKLAAKELEKVGLAKASQCIDGDVVRLINAYPVYDTTYRENRDVIKEWLNATFTNLFPAGRGGLHTYNNQDHSMMAAILSVRKAQFGDLVDIWEINTDEEYGEEGAGQKKFEDRLVPRPLVKGESVTANGNGHKPHRAKPETTDVGS